jgi:hypothetical protein
MFITRMNGPVDTDPSTTRNPTWPQIRDAILQLNGKDKTLLILGAGDPVPHMGIGGGGGSFICYVTEDNRAFHNLENPSAGEDLVSLIAGGQRSDYRARLCVDAETVLKAARVYSETGQLEPALSWARQRSAASARPKP